MLKSTNTLVKSRSLFRIQCISVTFNTAPNLHSSAHLWSNKTIINYQLHLFCCQVCFVIIQWWWLQGWSLGFILCVCFRSGKHLGLETSSMKGWTQTQGSTPARLAQLGKGQRGAVCGAASGESPPAKAASHGWAGPGCPVGGEAEKLGHGASG